MNMKLFILFAAALFVTLWWVANFIVAIVKAFICASKDISFSESGWGRVIGALLIAFLWAAVYCM